MKELSLNILDVAKNSVKAEASLIEIELIETEKTLLIRIKDDGYGMDKEFLSRVLDPFSTSRTTRKVGLGLPLLKLAAEQTEGTLSISSVPRGGDQPSGTTVEAFFHKDHIDFTPLGDIVSTIELLIQGNPDIDFRFVHIMPDKEVSLDTRELREVLGDEVPLNDFAVLSWIRGSLEEQYEEQGSNPDTE